MYFRAAEYRRLSTRRMIHGGLSGGSRRGAWVAILLIVMGALRGCGGTGGDLGAGGDSYGDLSDTTVWVKERGIVLSPSSRVLLALLEQQGVPFDSRMVSSDFPLVVSSSEAREAVMLGVYSVDALYFVYGGDDDAVQRCFFRLGLAAEALGLMEELQLQELALACSRSLGADGLLAQIGSRLVKLSTALRAKGREDLYALIAASSWVESTRILSNIALSSGREELYRLVAEQRFLLSEVGELLSGYVYALPAAGEMYNQLATVNGVYGGVQISYRYEAAEIDTSRHFSKLYGSMQIAMSKAQLRAIVDALEATKTAMLRESGSEK